MFLNRIAISSILGMSVLLAAPASAQIEWKGTFSADSLRLTTEEDSESRASYLMGLEGGYRKDPWSVSAEYASGDSTVIQREKAELNFGYSLSDSFELTAGARNDAIQLNDVSYFFFLFIPVGVTVEEAEVDLTNVYVGMNYETDQSRKVGLIGSARLYRGWADVSTPGRSVSDDCEGVRGELGIRMARKNGSLIIGAGYESFQLSDVAIDLASEPILFVQYRIRIPVP